MTNIMVANKNEYEDDKAENRKDRRVRLQCQDGHAMPHKLNREKMRAVSFWD